MNYGTYAEPHRGALVTVDGGKQTAILFQYNPASLKRTLQPQTYGAEQGARSEAVMFKGAPIETISVEIELDALGFDKTNDATTQQHGIGPEIAALELLVYPTVQQVDQHESWLARGYLTVAPYVAPLTVFVFGGDRIVPVAVEGVTVLETLFDADLTPMQARVALNLRALSYSDLAKGQPGYELFLHYQTRKEQLAALIRDTSSSDIAAATGVPSSDLK